MNTSVKKYEVLEDLLAYFKEEFYSFPQEFSDAMSSSSEIPLKIKDLGSKISGYIAAEKFPINDIKNLINYINKIDNERQNLISLHQKFPEFFPTLTNIVQFSQELIDSYPYLGSIKDSGWGDGGHVYQGSFAGSQFYAVNEDNLCGLLQNLANIFTKKGGIPAGQPLEEVAELLVNLAKLLGRLSNYVAPNAIFKNPPSIVQELNTCRKLIIQKCGSLADLYLSHFLDEVMHDAHQSLENLKQDCYSKQNDSMINLSDYSGYDIKTKYKGLATLSQFIKNLFPKE